ncbi:MAG TPA: RNA 2',3'-cyclic phosphodiesterase [Allosphingosinicella sp.]|nr:RNA 2',3'-cyclic phosphodiesterase [Allosphingosinicella sp.]
MHRLFVAIRPPRVVREQLLSLMGGVGGARWQTDDQLHLTLRFIGEVGRHQAEDVAAALGSIHHPSFEVGLSGIGAFERRGHPEVLWAGVSPHEPLKALHNKVDQACVRAGVEPERRAYHPHITLARLKRGSGPVNGLLDQARLASGAPFAVDGFGLFESTLTPEGAVYSMVQRYSLG